MMVSLLVYEKKRLVSESEQRQFEELDKFARVCEDTMIVFDEPALFKYAKNLVSLSSPKIVYAGFVYPKELAGSPWVWELGTDRIRYVEDNDADVAAVQSSGQILIRKTTVNGRPVIELSKPVQRIGYVRLGYSQDVMSALLRETIQKSLKRFSIVGCIAIIFGLILASLFSAALSRPIKNLMEAANAIARGQKGVKIPEGRNDELGKLTKTFNHMSEELIKLDQLKDDFMSHVTHELSSPLT
jgi:methyl-accepting chemotaxis protein